MAEFEGRVAIVTGASRRIGRAVAALLTERGAKLVLVGLDRARIDLAASEIGKGTLAVAGDVGEGATAATAVALAVEQFGRLDIPANIAGAYPTALREDTTGADMARSIGTNFSGTFYFCRSAVSEMRERGSAAAAPSSTCHRWQRASRRPVCPSTRHARPGWMPSRARSQSKLRLMSV